jgi:hypothetical protein
VAYNCYDSLSQKEKATTEKIIVISVSPRGSHPATKYLIGTHENLKKQSP